GPMFHAHCFVIGSSYVHTHGMRRLARFAGAQLRKKQTTKSSPLGADVPRSLLCHRLELRPHSWYAQTCPLRDRAAEEKANHEALAPWGRSSALIALSAEVRAAPIRCRAAWVAPRRSDESGRTGTDRFRRRTLRT